MDASVTKSRMGIDVVVRNGAGYVKAAMAQTLPNCASTLAMEAQAIIQGICFSN